MWLINKWDYQTIDTEADILYTVSEEEIYKNMPKLMPEVSKNLIPTMVYWH